MAQASEVSEKNWVINECDTGSSRGSLQPHNDEEDDITGELTASLLRRARELVSSHMQDTAFTQKVLDRAEYLNWIHEFIIKQQNVLKLQTAVHSRKNEASSIDAQVVHQKEGSNECTLQSKEKTDSCHTAELDKGKSSNSPVLSNPFLCAKSDGGDVDNEGNGVSCTPLRSLHLIQPSNAEQNGSARSSSVCDTSSATDWRHFRTWIPSEVALSPNVPQPLGSESAPVRHRLCFITHIHDKPRGFAAKNAAVRRQGRYCKSCLCPLRRFVALRSWSAARFCHYTGMFYCTECHAGRTCVIPARVLHEWDFKPRPVCDEAHDFLELQRDRPLFCISAVNPLLYDRVPLLRMARWLRVQVMALREIGVQCRVFRRLVYRIGAVNLSEEAGEDDERFSAEYFVPSVRRYLMEDSEVWSLTDLLDIYRCAPTLALAPQSPAFAEQLQALSRAVAVATSDSDVTVFLKRLRAHMVRHIMQRGCAVCMRHSSDTCHWCAPASALSLCEEQQQQRCRVFAFDILHTRSCTQCGAVFHKQCFAEMQRKFGGRSGCMRCYTDCSEKDMKNIGRSGSSCSPLLDMGEEFSGESWVT